jgi:predicted MPP superfamily phosphohydrolase
MGNGGADQSPGRDAEHDRRLESWATERHSIERGSHWVSPAGQRPRWRSKLFSALVGVFALGMRLAGLYERGRRNALAPQLVELDLSFASLPAAFDGYRILHITDTHLDALPELAAVASRMIAGIEVDLLMLTGDVLADPEAPPKSATVPLAHLLADVVVRDRRLAVLGNHDSAAMVDALDELGFQVLLNQSIALIRQGERIVITGLDDVHCFYTDAARTALFDGDGDFRIALVHSPEMADHAAEAGIALYLCGHTHGGQVCLPGGRALLTRLTRCHHAASGLWRDGPTTGYTSRGLGTSWPPLRYNCPGELTLITLRRAVDRTAHAAPSHLS